MGGGTSKDGAQGATPCSQYERGKVGVFVCDGKCGAVGSVWGSNPYTADSCLCRAARHAGVIGSSGGKFVVKPANPPPAEYKPSSQHGITTYDYKVDPHGIVIESVTSG